MTIVYLPPQYFNDIWRYNQVTSRWTWIAGDSLRNQSAEYGILGAPSLFNKSGGRSGFQSWSDPATGRLWIFGGEGYPENGVGQLRDMLLISAGDAALPVRFGSFNVREKENAVILDWTTLQEQNASAFVIERSSDGISYMSIGSVNATGNTMAVSKYSFTDYSPVNGNNFYRIRQIDADNRFLYSEVKRIVINYALNRVAVVQNPVQDQLRLQFNLVSGETLLVQLKNTTGQLVMSRNINSAAGRSIVDLDVASIRSGLYYLHVTGKNFTETISILKK
jgi:hypothetical protein